MPTLATLTRLACAVVTAASLCTATPAAAQDYPSRQVRLIVPFAAGGPADIYARAIGGHLQTALGQAFVIENRPGAGAIVGTDAAAKSAPDGYTLLVMSNAQTVNESLFATKPYQLMRDFVAVAPINASELLLVAHPSSGLTSVADLLREAKAKPGALNYASSGPGTPYHMAGELFKTMAGVNLVHVPYKGSGEARTGILSGQVQVMFDAITTMTEQAQAGKVKALATTGKARSAILPNVPTVSEAGVPGFEATIWLGVMAPRGTPTAILQRLNSEINKIQERADVREAWAKAGATPLRMNVDEFTKYLHDDIAKWKRVVEVSGAKPNQ